MTTGWLGLSLFLPPIVAALAGGLFRGRTPPAGVVIALNALVPGAGLAAAARPMLEIVLGVLFADAALLVTGGPENLGLFLPIMVIGGIWGSLHTELSPIAVAARTAKVTSVRPVSSAPGSSRTPSADSPGRSEGEQSEDAAPGYKVRVGCTECGADVEVPVLSRMARCTFCGTHHLVIGHDETLNVTIPERVLDLGTLRDAVLDHYRYQHYLKLYRSSVAHLEASATEVGPTGTLTTRSDVSAAAAAAERMVARKADSYRAQLASTLQLGRVQHFLAPYRHGMGTLYQAAFGRSRENQEKRLRFAVGAVEAAVLAAPGLPLPAMGRLSYLKALVPAAQCPDDVRTLPLELGEDVLTRAYGELDRKQLVRDLSVIRLGTAFSQEVAAVIWRGWWIADVTAPGIGETLLVDGAAGSVAGPAPVLDPDALVELPESARRPGSGLRFVPMECPTCGHEFPFDVDAVLHFCHNCHRVCRVDGDKKTVVEYRHQPSTDGDDCDLVPFWHFPLRLATADGNIITDLMHLKDGIDGTFDQIGDGAAMRRHGVMVPAVRCINPRLMAAAFQRLLLFTLRSPPRPSQGRFPLDSRPGPWSVSLAEPEARRLLPLYLANVFSRRDIVRVNVHQVGAWLFEARQEARGTLAYIPVPRPITEPFRAYVGRYRSQAVRHARAESRPTD